MAGRPGQALTAREVEEIEIHNEQGFPRPNKYNDVMMDGARGYRYMTAEEKRAGDESARQQARVLQAREKAVTQVREAAERRGADAEVDAIEGAAEEASSEPTVTTFGAGDTGMVATPNEAPMSAQGSAQGSAPMSAPKPMPASMASALRQAGPPKKAAPAESSLEGRE